MRGYLLGGRYQVDKIIGAGGFGQTYLARDTHRPGNPQCVVKHLKPAVVNAGFLESARRLFQSEAETLEKLGNHDQIPRLLAYFEENQEFYLVQEFIQGNSLGTELQPTKRWSESKVYQLLQEGLEILVFVHSHRVIHRDIKPDNLIRRQHDNKLVLVDFGSVKQAWKQQVVTAPGYASPTANNSLQTTIAIGTPGYMPTEQGRGKPRPNSDIYALGMIAIQALTGMNPVQLIEESDNGEIPWQHYADVNEALAFILTKMVRYHFKNRYQTAAEGLQALQLLINPYQQQLNQAEMPVQQRYTLQYPAFSLLPGRKKLSAQNNTLVAPTTSSSNPINSQINSASADLCSEPPPTANTSSVTQGAVFWSVKHQELPASQDVASPTPASSKTQVDLQQSDASIPTAIINNRSYWRIGAAITGVLMSAIALFAYWKASSTPSNLGEMPEQIKMLKAEGKSEQCTTLASKVPQDSQLHTDAQVLYECQLAQAKRFAAEGNFSAAITETGKIPQNTTFYQDAQQLSSQWSSRMLAMARNKYHSGKLSQAIAIVKAVPETSPVYQSAQVAIKQWDGEWKQSNSKSIAARKAVNEAKRQKAKSKASKVITTASKQQKIRAIIPHKAKSKIAKSTKTVATRQPKRYTSKRSIHPAIKTKARITTKWTRRTVVIKRFPRVTKRKVNPAYSWLKRTNGTGVRHNPLDD